MSKRKITFKKNDDDINIILPIDTLIHVFKSMNDNEFSEKVKSVDKKQFTKLIIEHLKDDEDDSGINPLQQLLENILDDIYSYNPECFTTEVTADD